MKRRSSLFDAIVLFTLAASVAAQEPRVVLIQSHAEPKFDVVYHRAMTTAAPAVFGGLIGAGIAAGVESDQDQRKRDTLSPHVSAQAWNDFYVKTLNDTLVEKGFEPRWVIGKDMPKDLKADVYVLLYPSSYGFRMIDSSTSVVASYVEFEAIYSREPPNPRKKLEKEPFYLIGKKQQGFSDFVSDTASVNTEIEAVLVSSARRLANKIIYNLK
jgi:hypothetical protein